MDVKFYRHNLIVATEGRGLWILDAVPALEGLKAAGPSDAAAFFKPADGYRVGGGRGFGGGAPAVPSPTFYYWFRDEPTAPVSIEVKDAAGTVVWSASSQPAANPPGRAAGAAPVNCGVDPAPGFGTGAGAGGGRGFGRGGGPAGPPVSAHKGLNVVTWNDMNLPVLFTIPPCTTMWQGGAFPPRVPLGVYTVKVTSGSWSQSQTFHLGGDPRYVPAMTDAESAAQLKMSQEVGGWAKSLYDHLAQIRDAKKQAADIAAKTPAMAAASKTLTDRLVEVEGQMTQLKGEAGQDSLNYAGRLDNQIVVLNQYVTGTDRKLGQPVLERYADLKPQYDAMAAKWTAVLTTDVATFNAAAAKAGAASIVIK
jgi:hypothetical protein